MATTTVVRISDVDPRFDGEYELDLSVLTNRELHLIKQESGVRAGEFEEAANAGDSDLLVAFALIALKRAGRDVSPSLLWDAPGGKIVFDVTGEAEEDPNPPVVAAGSPSASGGDVKPSGLPSSPSGDSPANVPSPTGSPSSDTAAVSDLETSAT